VLAPDDTLVWALYLHNGYVYTADDARGIDILKLTPGATAARHEVVAPPQSAKQRAFLAPLTSQLRGGPATRGLCLLQTL
jgi:hypothetical protein